MITTAQAAGGTRALTLAFLAAMIEGFDLQAAGVAAPRLAPVFGLGPGQMGLFFSAATIGLIFGALGGGHIADRFGRRTGLAISLATFGLLSLATPLVNSVEALIVVRFLTGVGLGGALPNLVSIAAEAVAPEKRGRAVAVMYAGVPLGGALVSLLARLLPTGDWQTLFIVGGVLPLLLVVPILAALPPLLVPPHAHATAPGRWRRLFEQSPVLVTLLLWCASFFGLLVVYLLLNWLPALLVTRGFSQSEAALVQIGFNLGGAAGSLVGGQLLDSARRVGGVGACFAFIVAALLSLAMLPADLGLTIAAGALLGGGVLAAQAILYGIAPQCYPAAVRGTGVGLAVAVGRFGSVAGPLVAGMLMAAGFRPSDVLIAIVPTTCLSGIVTVMLLLRRRPAAVAAPAG
ncbi:3-(3-hydroxy-phenyl)propionate transporter [Rhodovastum atsumiense]|uniref:MFS transporter n=1 Tax=Rhodovastum atsumiense TaxID=504468 RepID=A0A5M6IXK8_9PROT|nr:MFS transporter [Rhodovastum atsumiense]KAA5612128.1 MFS transporter [Rhodovastum atsumiense]CAH2603930.1 3-(3-hydroxy-phenyl)propionate transporter [Rhodovastum atsumiense]